MDSSVDRIFSAAIEGQAQSLRFIQQQLSKLHEALTKASNEIRAAIQNDTKQSTAEAEIQYTLTLENVASFFAEANFESALKSEYRLARAENASDNLAPFGSVYIVPSTYNLVFSCVTAVAAAVAAGNCVVLEVCYSILLRESS